MDGTATAALGPGGFMTTLGERLNADEAFIVIVLVFIMALIIIIGFALWKIWGEFKHMMKDREDTASKRNQEFSRQQNEITELRGMITSHFQIHLEIDRKMERMEEVRDKVNAIDTKLGMLMDFWQVKPKTPK